MDTFVQGVQLATLDSLDNKGPGVNYTDIMATKADHAAELQACLKDIDGAQQRLRALLIGEHGIQQLDQEMVGDIAAAIRAQIVELVGCVHHLENYAIGDMSYTATAEAANSRKPPRKFERIVGADGFVRPTWDWDRWNKKDTEQQVRELHDAGYSLREITKVTGCSYGTAHRIVRKLLLAESRPLRAAVSHDHDQDRV